MDKKIIGGLILVVVLVGGAMFYGGIKYASRGGAMNFRTMTPEERQARFAQFGGGGGGGGGQRGGMRGGGAGFVAGEVIAKDDTSITVKLRDGGSKIIFYSGSTEVGKSVSGSPADISVGSTVVANGTANQDGSVSAESIQIRPPMSAPAPAAQ